MSMAIQDSRPRLATGPPMLSRPRPCKLSRSARFPQVHRFHNCSFSPRVSLCHLSATGSYRPSHRLVPLSTVRLGDEYEPERVRLCISLRSQSSCSKIPVNREYRHAPNLLTAASVFLPGREALMACEHCFTLKCHDTASLSLKSLPYAAVITRSPCNI